MNRNKILRQLSPARMWARRKHLHIENKGLMLMALLLATALFIVSRQPVSDVKLFNVPLEYRGQRSNVEISGEITQAVSIRVRGPRDLVRNLTPTQLAVTADLSNKEAGARTIQLHPSDVSLPDNSIQVVQIEPASIRLELEPKVKKHVPVEVHIIGTLADGLELYKSTSEPASIEIEGAESQVNRVTRLLTETINLSGHNNNFQVMVDVETPHPSLRVQTAASLKVTVEIGERRIFKRFSGIPIQSLTPNRLVTKTVEVELYGPASALDALPTKYLRVELATDSAANQATAIPKIILPPNASPHIEIRKIIPNEVRLKK